MFGFFSTKVYCSTSIKIKTGPGSELEVNSTVTSEIQVDGSEDEECEEVSPEEDDEYDNTSDIVRIFGTGNLDDGEMADSVVLIFSDGTINGVIQGDCVVIGGKVNLKRETVINGDLVAIFSSLNKERDVLVRGDEVCLFTYQTAGILTVVKSIFLSWDIFLAFILLLLGWKYVHGLTDRFTANPASYFIKGFIWLIGFIPLIIVLAISILGIFLIPLVPLIYMLGFAFGFAVFANYLGEKLASVTGKDFSQPFRAITGLIIILIVFKIISFFPLLGGLSVEVIKMIIRTFGLGLFISVLLERAWKKKNPVI